MEPKKGGRPAETYGNTPDGLHKVLTFPRRRKQDPFPEFPARMVVAVDGWAEINKEGAGEWVAHALGGVLMDSGRYHRALIKASQGCGADVGDPSAAAEFCQRVTLRTRFVHKGGCGREAQVAVNDRWFSQSELAGVTQPALTKPAFMVLREKVKGALRSLEHAGRLVIMGCETGFSIFPETPYKFFLHTTEGLRDENARESVTYPGVVRPMRDEHYCVTRIWNGFKVLFIDTARLSASETGGIVLAETVLRAMEAGVYGRNHKESKRAESDESPRQMQGAGEKYDNPAGSPG